MAFRYSPSEWAPFRDTEALERCGTGRRRHLLQRTGLDGASRLHRTRRARV